MYFKKAWTVREESKLKKKKKDYKLQLKTTGNILDDLIRLQILGWVGRGKGEKKMDKKAGTNLPPPPQIKVTI